MSSNFFHNFCMCIFLSQIIFIHGLGVHEFYLSPAIKNSNLKLFSHKHIVKFITVSLETSIASALDILCMKVPCKK